MITFVPPVDRPLVTPPAHLTVPTIEDLVETAYSRLPAHSVARQRVVELNHESVRVAAALGAALPAELQDFWEAYTGWFAIYSVAPLLANREVAAQAVTDYPGESQALILEDWRQKAWWSGRWLLQPAIREVLEAAGLRVKARPGAAAHGLRRLILRQAARWYGNKLLREQQGPGEGRARQPKEPVCDVLWLSAGASSVDLIARLHEAVQIQQGLRSQILDFSFFGSDKQLLRHGLPHTGIEAFCNEVAFSAARRVAGQLAGWWPQIARCARDLAPKLDLTPLQYRTVLDRLQLVLWRDAPAWTVQLQAARQALQVYNPKVVVGFHVYGPSIAPAVILAQHSGIPRVCLQHGVVGPRYLGLPCLGWNENLLFSSYAADIIRESHGEEAGSLTVTGNCLYDETSRQAVQPRSEVLALRQGVNGLVVLCTQYNEALHYSEGKWWLAEIARVSRELGVRLAIKLHPSDTESNIALYRTVLQPSDDRVLLVQHGQYPLNELLAACDAMITRDSTVVFEANLLGKPAVTVNLSYRDAELPYAETGGALGVYKFEDIAPAIMAVLRDEAVQNRLAATRDEFLLHHVGPRDGRATERITAILAAWATGPCQNAASSLTDT